MRTPRSVHRTQVLPSLPHHVSGKAFWAALDQQYPHDLFESPHSFAKAIAAALWAYASKPVEPAYARTAKLRKIELTVAADQARPLVSQRLTKIATLIRALKRELEWCDEWGREVSPPGSPMATVGDDFRTPLDAFELEIRLRRSNLAKSVGRPAKRDDLGQTCCGALASAGVALRRSDRSVLARVLCVVWKAADRIDGLKRRRTLKSMKQVVEDVLDVRANGGQRRRVIRLVGRQCSRAFA